MPTITRFNSVIGPQKGTPPKGTTVDVPDLQAFAQHILCHPSRSKKTAFTVNTFEAGVKHQSAFLAASGFVAIDLEGPKTEPLPEGAIEAILGNLRDQKLGFVWYHTHSHNLTPEKGERARVILSCSPAPATPELYRALVRQVMSEFPEGTYDPCCVDPARGFFYPPEEHPATFVPGRQFIWDPATALPPRTAQTTRPDIPDELCCDEDTLEAFVDAFREVVEVSAGNRNGPALWFLGALHAAGADEDLCRHCYESAFQNHPEHLQLFDARYQATSSKDPANLKIWGDFEQAGPFSNPNHTDGLMGYLGKIDGEALKAALTPPATITTPTTAITPPGELPTPKPNHTAVASHLPKDIIAGFLAEYFGRNIRIHQRTIYFYDQTTWQLVPESSIAGLLNHYVKNTEGMITNKTGSFPKPLYAPRAHAQRIELLNELYSPNASSPTWVDDDVPFEDTDHVALANGILNTKTFELKPFTPEIRTVGCLPVSLEDEAAPTPTLDAFFRSCDFSPEEEKTWLDAVSYLIFGDIPNHQKAVLLVGPPRAGKGVTAKLVEAIVGRQNTTPMQVRSFGSQFGLAAAIGKRLMIVYDAEFSRAGFSGPTAGNLKNIVAGEDIDVDRKHRTVWSGKLGKLLVCSNVAPNVEGGDRALASRWHIVQFHRSHLNREDHAVSTRLIAEAGPIFNRLARNWVDVLSVGRLHQSESAEEYREQTVEACDPVVAFMAENFIRTGNPDDTVSRSDAWEAFKCWQDESVTMREKVGKGLFYQGLRTQGVQDRRCGAKGTFSFVGVKLV